jgi:hypothetical protein
MISVKKLSNRAWAKLRYKNPIRDFKGLQAGRIDQGVDYSVTTESPIYALGNGVITIYRPTSGWPGGNNGQAPGAYIAYRLTNGPAKGHYVYFAENITLNPNLKVGDSVDKNTKIATQHEGFANCETGWASEASNGYSPQAYGCYTEGTLTDAGHNFDHLMQILGAPAGLILGRVVKCPLPANWPRW